MKLTCIAPQVQSPVPQKRKSLGPERQRNCFAFKKYIETRRLHATCNFELDPGHRGKRPYL